MVLLPESLEFVPVQARNSLADYVYSDRWSPQFRVGGQWSRGERGGVGLLEMFLGCSRSLKMFRVPGEGLVVSDFPYLVAPGGGLIGKFPYGGVRHHTFGVLGPVKISLVADLVGPSCLPVDYSIVVGGLIPRRSILSRQRQ